MRFDRLSTLYFFHPLGQMMRLRDEIRIPILMYHSITNDSENELHPYYRINTSPEIFAEHMKFLYENNYSVITLAEAVKLLFNSQPATRYAVVTFDDGFRRHTRFCKNMVLVQQYFCQQGLLTIKD